MNNKEQAEKEKPLEMTIEERQQQGKKQREDQQIQWQQMTTE